MEEKYEVIDFNNNIPICCFTYHLGYYNRHWHNSMELIFVLSGEVKVSVNNKSCMLSKEDILLINCNEIHEFSAKNCILFSIQINTSLFDKSLVNENEMYFDCNSSLFEDKSQFHSIKAIVKNFINTNSSKESFNKLMDMSLSYHLLFELMLHFKIDNLVVNMRQAQKNSNRMNHILDYINEHFTENLSLAQLADKEHLSVPYLSKFFTENMHINFISYINKLRLNVAIEELLTSNESIEIIAHNSGFSNAKSFVQLFKKEYNMLPSQYRNEYKDKFVLPEQKSSSNNYIIGEHNDYLNRLASYLLKKDKLDTHKDTTNSEISSFTIKYININNFEENLKHTFKTFISAGKAKNILSSEVQYMLKILQKEIGYKYIKFTEVLSKDMLVYNEITPRNAILNFVYVDKVLDFLLSIEAKPLIELSFISKSLSKTLFESTFIINKPTNINKWNHLIREFMLHLLDRYGIEKVEQWKFILCNESYTSDSLLDSASNEAFYNFYKTTFNTIKTCNKNICFGSEASYFASLNENNWLTDFTKWCLANDCIPDFINVNFCKTDFENSSKKLKLSDDSNTLKKLIANLKIYANKYFHENHEIFITEYNPTKFHYDLMNDTCFKACDIMKKLLENYDDVHGFSISTLTDFFEDNPNSKELFQGGTGLFTYNRIKKPSYYAFLLLNKLGSTLIDKGDGYFITREKEEIRIMLYNYINYPCLYNDGENFDITFVDRYSPFLSENKKKFSLCLKGINKDNYEVTEFIVNRQYGSSFDKWVQMGAYHLTSKEEIETLDALSRPMINKYFISSLGDTLEINAILDLLEIRYISIKPLKTHL